MLEETWERLKSTPLYLDQTGYLIEYTQAELEKFYLPLAEQLLATVTPTERCIVAIAGPPGCGKTVFASLLAAVINALAGSDISLAAGLDGWHYPNAYLESHNLHQNDQEIPLRAIKGSPETYDSAAMTAWLKRVRGGKPTHFPVYSRELHDPIAGKGKLGQNQRILLFEGNYLLMNEQPWLALRPFWDYRVFLNAPLDVLLDNLLERHIRGGKSLAEAQTQIELVDLPNIKRVLSQSTTADVTYFLNKRHKIERVVLS
jgi:pantothenate kinase